MKSDGHYIDEKELWEVRIKVDDRKMNRKVRLVLVARTPQPNPV